jgi:hypothetical protein
VAVEPKTIPANHALLFSVGEKQGPTLHVGYNADFQELSSLGMDRALGAQKASLAAAVQLQNDVIDSFKNASWCTPELSEWLDGIAHAFASCMQLQMTLFSLMGSQVSSTIASIPGMNARIAGEVVERSMDIAIGPHKKA